VRIVLLLTVQYALPLIRRFLQVYAESVIYQRPIAQPQQIVPLTITIAMVFALDVLSDVLHVQPQRIVARVIQVFN
jgi:hypothetical protein